MHTIIEVSIRCEMITLVSVLISIPCCSLALSCSNTLSQEAPQADFFLSMNVPYSMCEIEQYIPSCVLLTVSYFVSEMKATGVGSGFSLTADCTLLPSCEITVHFYFWGFPECISALKGLQNESRIMSKCTALVNTAVSQTLTAVRNLEISCNNVHIRVYLVLKKSFSKRSRHNDIVCSS